VKIMREILDIQVKLLPDLVEVMQKRYTILNLIMISRVVGRRTLAAAMNMTERVLRGEIEFLKAQGLLEIESLGMRVTDSGLQLLEEMDSSGL
jgi:central glycolytic genes regulator